MWFSETACIALGGARLHSMWSKFKRGKVILPDIRTKRLSFGNILSWGWSICQTHFANILIVVLIINIPLNIATAAVTEPFPNSILNISESILDVLEAMAIMFIVESAVNNETMSFGDALRRAANRWASGILTYLGPAEEPTSIAR